MKSSLEKADYRRKRAVLLTARALALEDSDRDAARALALEAVKLAPDLVPAAGLAGRRLAEAGSIRQGRQDLDTAWLAQPASRHRRDLCQSARLAIPRASAARA